MLANTIVEYIRSADPGVVAALGSLFIDQLKWIQSRRDRNEDATLDEYLEDLRRRNHQELVDILLTHREELRRIFAVELDVVTELQGIRADIAALTQLEVRPDRLRVAVKEHLKAAKSVRHSEWQDVPFRMQLTLINDNNSRVKISRAKVTCEGPEGPLTLICNNAARLDRAGDSTDIMLNSQGSGKWRKGEPLLYREKSLTLTADQASTPLEYEFIDGKVVPR